MHLKQGLQIKAPHSRVPAWKISKCIQALNAKPIDLAHIAEVTEIQFASNDLVAVAAKCLAELSEASSMEASTEQPAGDAVTSQSASGPTESKAQNAESEPTEQKQSEETTEPSSKQQGENDSPAATSEAKQGDDSQSKGSSDQRATAQDSTQHSSSSAAKTNVPQHRKEHRRYDWSNS